MSHKQKPKSNDFVDTFFNTILFNKRFRFETSVPIDVTMERLHELSGELHGWLYRKPRYVIKTKPMVDHYTVDIRAKDTRQQYTIAHSTATVHTDLNRTVVEGEIRCGVVYLFLLILSILWMFFIFQVIPLRMPFLVISIALVFPIFNFVHMLHQRNRLFNKIQSAITPRLSDRTFTKSKLQNRASQNDAEWDAVFAVFDDDEHSDYDQQ